MTEGHVLIAILARAYDRRSWHGTNLRGSIRGLTIDQAAWRPDPARHNIWELVVHAAYWKYAAGRRLTGGTRGSFPLSGSNWFERPQPKTLKAWRSDVALLDDMHRALLEAVAAVPLRALNRRGRSEYTPFEIVAGAAAHDLYHAGQIQLLKRLQS